MIKEISLDSILLSPDAVAAWHEMAGRFAEAIKQLEKMRGSPISIPDERARANENGTLTIFVQIPDALQVSMEVPRGHWSYQQ